MSERWTNLDALMRRLGALRAAADDTEATADDHAMMEAAIATAAQAIDAMIDASQDRDAIARARDALMVAEELVARVVKGREG